VENNWKILFITSGAVHFGAALFVSLVENWGGVESIVPAYGLATF
jgi:hypothetical protein